MECLAERRPAAPGWMGVAGSLWKRLRSECPEVVITHTHSANAFAGTDCRAGRRPGAYRRPSQSGSTLTLLSRAWPTVLLSRRALIPPW